TILEFGGGAAGPVATRYFADHGATVIRVESRQRPDFLRTLRLTPDSPGGLDGAHHFAVLNANKLSVALNLARPEGVAVARRLALWAEAVAENFAPGAMAKWGLDYASLVKERPDLVMISAAASAESPGRVGGRARHAARRGVFACGGEDRWVAIVVQDDEDWGRRGRAMGEPAWATDAGLATTAGRLAQVDGLGRRLAEWTAGQEAEALAECLQTAGVEAGPVEDFGDLHEDPQLSHRRHFRDVEHAVLGRH